MAGWKRYNDETGEIETGLYERPFIVRGRRPHYEDVTITAFATEAEAREWVRFNAPNYTRGISSFSSLHVENWNE